MPSSPRRARIARPYLLRALLALFLGCLTTLAVAWAACNLQAPPAHGYLVSGGGQKWSITWGGNAALRWEAIWYEPTSPNLRGVTHVEGNATSDRIPAAMQQTAAALPVHDLADAPAAPLLHLHLAPAPRPAPDVLHDLTVIRVAGWPMHCLYGHQAASIRHNAAPATRGLAPAPWQDEPGGTLYPYLPLLTGLLIDTLFYSAFFAVPLCLPRLLRHHLRRRKGRCTMCRYDLRGLAPDEQGRVLCPECGASAPVQRRPASR